MQTVNRLQFATTLNKNLPISYKYVQNQRIKLKNYQKAKSISLTNKSSLSSTLNLNQTQSSFRPKFITSRFLLTSQKYRSHSRNSERQNCQDYIRPHTQLKGRIKQNRNNAYTPLQIINTKISDSQHDFQLVKVSDSIKKVKTKLSLRPKSCSYLNQNHDNFKHNLKPFLRKGTAINKSILLNIFKSKFNQKVGSSSSSYSDKNPQLAQIINKAIPKPLKDVIGPQQMLKMSRIMTGIKIKSTNLEQNLVKAIAIRKKNKIIQKKTKIQDQDNQTLRSIKRW